MDPQKQEDYEDFLLSIPLLIPRALCQRCDMFLLHICFLIYAVVQHTYTDKRGTKYVFCLYEMFIIHYRQEIFQKRQILDIYYPRVTISN